MIDSHQHFWKFNPVRDAWITDDMQTIRRDFLPDDLKPLLKYSGIFGCVAIQADQSMEETNFLLELSRQHFFIKGVVGWIDLRSPRLNHALEKLSAEKKLKGFRHIVQAESDPDFMLRPEFLNGVREIISKGYSYDILIRDYQLPMALAFSSKLPQGLLVIDHLAKPPIRSGEWKAWAAEIKKFTTLDHVHCKVSGMVTEAHWKNWQPEQFKIYLDVVTETFGIRRLLYGSDWPVCLLAADYSSQVNILHNYFSAFTPHERAAVFKGNAMRFYRL